MLIHEEKAEYDSWIRLIFIIPLGLFVASVIFAGRQDFEPSLVLLGEAVLFVLILYFVFPRRYQLYQDRLRIVLGAPLAINIRLSTIKQARHSSGSRAFFYPGVRFATSSRSVVEIVRRRGINYVISPKNSDSFLAQLNQAISSRAG